VFGVPLQHLSTGDAVDVEEQQQVSVRDERPRRSEVTRLGEWQAAV
jgi:hypothetical protein